MTAEQTTPEMNEQELNALVAKLAALEADAAVAPWGYLVARGDATTRGIYAEPGVFRKLSDWTGNEANVELVIEARNALPALLAALQAVRIGRAEMAARADHLQEKNTRLTEKVQAWCPHLATSGFITGDECCDECGLVDPYDQVGDR